MLSSVELKLTRRERDYAAEELVKRLPIDTTTLAAFCRTYRVAKLSLFGSVLKGKARPDSDVDLLVEFKQDATPTLLDLAGMEEELSRLLGGRRVDLRTPAELSRYFRDQVLREAEPQYVAVVDALPPLIAELRPIAVGAQQPPS